MSFSVCVQKILVEYEYPVYFTSDVFSPVNDDLVEAVSRKEPDRRHRLFFVVERAVAQLFPRLLSQLEAYVTGHGNRLELVTAPHVIDGGEAIKNSAEAVVALQERVHAVGLDRHSYVVAIGGGALLDMVGYVAASVHRGIRLIRMPTTVLAQNDSGVGVKNGVNAFGKKNFLGAFAPPFAVLNDRRFLETLSARDKRAGMAEAVKVALIRDGDFFEWLTRHAPELAGGELDPLVDLIERCARCHLSHIATSGDPFETGSARPLDFGHWAAHKIESLSQYRLRHGEAVAIGIALDALYSAEVGLLARDRLKPVLSLLGRLGFRLWDETLELLDGEGRPQVVAGLEEFREHLGGELTITLLRDIGRGVEVNEIREASVLNALNALRMHEAIR